MTREKCIALLKRYAEYDGMGIPNLTGCREAMKMAADLLSQPSLPSNLDEAAIKRMREPDMYLSDATIEEIGDALLKMAHFGAEWMAGQGYIKEGIARPDDCEIWVNFTDTDIEDGDKVIVQIRKKQ